MSDLGFEIGDRVELIIEAPDGNSKLFVGSCGTVVCVVEDTPWNVGVEWDHNIGGHSLGGRCRSEHGWRVKETMIRHCQVEEFEPASEAELRNFLKI